MFEGLYYTVHRTLARWKDQRGNMVDHKGNNSSVDCTSNEGYPEIIVKETGRFSPNIEFGNAYKTRAAHQNAVPGNDGAYVSILVFGYNNLQKHTKYCVESILKYTNDIDYELVLLDNGSTDGTFEYFKSVSHPKKKIVRITANKGAVYGQLIATKYLAGRYVVMIANDVYVTKNWLSNMLKCAESDERIGFVAPAADNVSNLQSISLSFKNLEEMQSKAKQHNVSDPRKWEERLRLMPAVGLYKKECLDIAGSMDYAFQHDFSDDDISFRIRRAGYKLMFCGDVFVHHVGPTVTGTSSGNKGELLKTGKVIFSKKYFGVDAWEHINNYEQLMLSFVNYEEKRGILKPEVLGIDVMCGAPILQLKNKLRHADIFDTQLSAFVQDPKYWLDLKTICEGTVVVDRLEYLAGHFAQHSFDYILLGQPINSYNNLEKILSDMLSLLKTDGQLLIKLRNNFDIKAFLDSMKKGLGSGNKSVTQTDIDNLNKALLRQGYAIQAARQSLYNLDNATKEMIRNVINKSEYAQNIDAAFNELLTEEYALKITRNVAIQEKTLVDQSAILHDTSSNAEISTKSRGEIDRAVSKEDCLSPHFQEGQVMQGITSIVLLTQNRLDQLKKCVKSIRKYTPEAHEIIFIDNGSTDSTVKWLHSQINENKNYRLIENKENVGLAKGRNHGIRLSQGEFILLLNQDVIVGEGWLSGMLECLNHAPDAGIVGPMTNSASGLQQVLDDTYRSVDYLDKYAAKFKERFLHRRIPCRNLSGFCMLFRRALMEKIGLLDERFNNDYFEDEDFCLRATLEGYKNYVAGDVFIHRTKSKESPGDRSIIDKKWTLSTASSEGKKLMVLKGRELANELYQKGKTDQAIEALINCIKIIPDSKEIYYELARILTETKKYSEVWEVVGTMPETAKNELKGLECAGYAKEGMGLDDEAAAYADRMLSSNKNYAAALNLQGVLAYKKGEKDKAQDYFNKAIDADPGYGEVHTNLGVLNLGMDKKDEAFSHLKKGFILSPEVPDVSSIYYSLISSLGTFSDAEADFREACRLYPNHKKLAFLYIDLLIQQGKFDSAMIKIEDALALLGLDDGILNAALAVREKIGPLQIEKASKKNSLSLCMIVKNEEKHLLKCLRSVRDVVDEIIIVDTGSTDKTIDIAKIFGAKLFDFPWTGDFSTARNHSLAQATGDWILVLDADEVIAERDLNELKALIQKRSSSPVAYSIVTRNYINNIGVIGWTPRDGQYPEEAGSGWVISTKVRLFSRRKDIFFTNPVHELLEHTLKKEKIPIHPSKIIVHHYGKLDIERDVQKGEDYYLLGKIKHESDPSNFKHIYELAKQAHQLHKYDETVELWLKLLSLMEADPQSPGYQEITKIVYGDPLAEIHTQLAAAYLLLDRYGEALTAATKSMESKVKLKEYFFIYAQCEIIAGSLKKASDALEELVSSTPEYLPALILKAVIFILEGKKENAQELFQLLRKKGVHITPFLNALAKQLHTHGKKREALLVSSMSTGVSSP